MKSPFVLALVILAALSFRSAGAEEPRHLLVAKFTLKKLEAVDLTDEQRKEFNRLSGDLRKETDALRKEAGISKEVMKRRDEAHSKLKLLKLPDEEYWPRLQKDAELNDTQLKAFRTTSDRYKKFRADAMGLLTDGQRAKLTKKGKKKS